MYRSRGPDYRYRYWPGEILGDHFFWCFPEQSLFSFVPLPAPVFLSSEDRFRLVHQSCTSCFLSNSWKVLLPPHQSIVALKLSSRIFLSLSFKGVLIPYQENNPYLSPSVNIYSSSYRPDNNAVKLQ